MGRETKKWCCRESRDAILRHDEAITRDATSGERLGIILVSDLDGKRDSKSH